jgi:hypothetical protein
MFQEGAPVSLSDAPHAKILFAETNVRWQHLSWTKSLLERNAVNFLTDDFTAIIFLAPTKISKFLRLRFEVYLSSMSETVWLDCSSESNTARDCIIKQ